jgi:hypothetical protein
VKTTAGQVSGLLGTGLNGVKQRPPVCRCVIEAMESHTDVSAPILDNPGLEQIGAPNAGVWVLRTALRSAARPPSARVPVELFCAATDMGQQTFDRAGRLGASAEPDSPKIAVQIDLGDRDFP